MTDYRTLYNQAHGVRDEFAKLEPSVHQYPLYAVTKAMTETLAALSRSYRVEEHPPIAPPTESGCVSFEHPIWFTVGSREEDRPDMITGGLRWCPRLGSPGDYAIEGYCQIMNPDVYPGDDLTCGPYMPLFALGIHRAMHGSNCPCDQCGFTEATVGTTYQLAQAFWILLGQKIILSDHYKADTTRPLSGKRRRYAPKREEVRILKFRQPDRRPADDGEAEPVDWSHRWLVNGFWRQQWWPTLQRHVPTWISPYIKGPADKPLVIREDLRVLER